MNTIDDTSFTVRLALNSGAQLNSSKNQASYQLQCTPEWVCLGNADYEVAVSSVAIPVHAIDLSGNGDYYVEFSQSLAGHDRVARCTFANITMPNAEKFVEELKRQMKVSVDLQAMFGSEDDVPYLTYSRMQRVSVHFRDATPNMDRQSLLRLSPQLCAKLGVSLLDQPFASSPDGSAVNQPIVGVSRDPVYVFRGHDSVHVSMPSFVEKGILHNSSWTSNIASIHVDRHLHASTYVDQYNQAARTHTPTVLTYFKCITNELHSWSIDLRLDNNQLVTWAYPHVDWCVTLQFRRAPRLGFID